MSDLAHDLIHIAVGHLLPKPKKYAWVSAVESGPYHIETNDSAANGGQGFKAICGAAGDFNFHLTGSQIFPSQKCKTCAESSTGNILDVAPQGEKELSNGSIRSDIQFAVAPERSEGLRLCDQRIIGNQQSLPEIQSAGEKHNQLHLPRQAGCVLDVANQGRGIAPSTESITVGDQGAVTVAAPFDRHGDDRFADNILRALEGLPQNGDDLEEEAAAEEGALIDASNMPYPEYERNGR